MRKLAIVGDVHYRRVQKPSSQADWQNLLKMRPLPLKLSNIEYSVNTEEEAFASLSFQFSNQNFEKWGLCACNEREKLSCAVKLNKPTRLVKIKQRNNLDGVSKICGLWLQAQDGSDNAKIDLCIGKG